MRDQQSNHVILKAGFLQQSSAGQGGPVELSEGLFPNTPCHSRCTSEKLSCNTTGVRTQLSEKESEGLVKRNAWTEGGVELESEMYIKNQIAGHIWGGIHLYFQHTGGKNTSHGCDKFKVRLVYIVNSRPATTTQRDHNSREGEGRKYERERRRGREGRDTGKDQKEPGVKYNPNTQTQAGNLGLKVSLNYTVSSRSIWAS